MTLPHGPRHHGKCPKRTKYTKEVVGVFIDRIKKDSAKARKEIMAEYGMSPGSLSNLITAYHNDELLSVMDL